MASLSRNDIEHLVTRLERVVELINAGHIHMAVAKVLADISALKCVLADEETV